MAKNKLKSKSKSKDLNIEIDYDKLAEAIVRANKIVEEKEHRIINENIEENTDKRSVKYQKLIDFYNFFICAKQPNEENNTSANLKILSTAVEFFYKLLAGALIFTIPILIVFFFLVIYNFDISSLYIIGAQLIILLYTVFFILTCFYLQASFRIAAKEVEKIKDIQLIATLFSSAITFIAMIAAIASVIVAMATGGLL